MNIIKALNDQFGKEIINGLSLNLGASNDEVQKSVDGALPALMGGLIKKARTKAGASELYNLLNKKGYDGKLLNNITNLFSGSASINLLKQGLDVLPSMLGGQSKMATILNIAGGLFGGGLSRSQSVFGMLAPVLLNFIGKKMRSDSLDQKGLVNLLTDQKDNVVQNLHQDIAQEMGFADKTHISESTDDSNETIDETVYETEVNDDTSGRRRFPKWLIPFGFVFGAIFALFLLTKACGEIPEEKQKALNAKKEQQQENRTQQKNQKAQSNKPKTTQTKPNAPSKPKVNNTQANPNNTKPTNTKPKQQNQANNTAAPKQANTNNPIKNTAPTQQQVTGGRNGVQNQTKPNNATQQPKQQPKPTGNNVAQNNNQQAANTKATPATRPGAQPATTTAKPSTKKYRGSAGNLTLTRSAESNFKKIAQIMNDNPSTTISIRAHNQDYKNPTQNATAKKNGITRAKLLQQLMINQGVQTNRIKIESLGNTEFLIPEDKGNARNQRISIKVN